MSLFHYKPAHGPSLVCFACDPPAPIHTFNAAGKPRPHECREQPSPLHAAALGQALDMIKYLIGLGLHVDVCDEVGSLQTLTLISTVCVSVCALQATHLSVSIVFQTSRLPYNHDVPAFAHVSSLCMIHSYFAHL